MKNLLNIERSFFRPAQYVGYASGLWDITKTTSSDGNWVAHRRDNYNIRIAAMTLSALSMKLLSYSKQSHEGIL